MEKLSEEHSNTSVAAKNASQIREVVDRLIPILGNKYLSTHERRRGRQNITEIKDEEINEEKRKAEKSKIKQRSRLGKENGRQRSKIS
jgi:hypothetical protein